MLKETDMTTDKEKIFEILRAIREMRMELSRYDDRGPTGDSKRAKLSVLNVIEYIVLR